jgi:hypothetical protein
MRELENDPSRTATAEEKLILSRYTGKGGNLEVEGVKGVSTSITPHYL